MSEEQRSVSGRRRIDRTGAAAPDRHDGGRRRVDALGMLALALPVVVVVALALLVPDEPPADTTEAPTATPLSEAVVGCPAAADPDAGGVAVSRVAGAGGGEVEVRAAKSGGADLAEDGTVSATDGRIGAVESDGDVLLTGRGSAAPGIVAGRTGTARSAAECRAPAYDEWFTGLGAAATESSVIELVNPDGGPAIVEIDLLGPGGPVDDEDLHGIRVPGHEVVRLNLSELSPRRGAVAAHVKVVRGRAVISVRHTHDPLGQARSSVDFVPGQVEPTTGNLLLGLPADASGEVFLANPGADEVRASLQVVTDRAVFSPAGLDDVRVPPGTVRQVSVDRILTGRAADGARGLFVASDQPLTATVQLLVGEDLGAVGPALSLADGQPTTAVVPSGPKDLVLGGASSRGVLRVTARDAAGRRLASERVEIGADRAAVVELPDDAVLVTVESSNTGVAGTVLLTGDRTGTLRLRPAELTALVPAVRPE